MACRVRPWCGSGQRIGCSMPSSSGGRRMSTRRLVLILGLLWCHLWWTTAASAQVQTLTLQTNASTGNGTIMTVSGLSVVLVTIVGSSGANRVVGFEGADQTGQYASIYCGNVGNTDQATSATAASTTVLQWRCPIAGMKTFRTPVSGGTTGTVTVTAAALANVSFLPRGSSGGGGGEVSFANPTAQIGMSAVNGSASTAMRSDSAPALNPAIAPTWTGIHTFGSTKLRISGTTSGVITLAVPAIAGNNTLTLPAGTTDFSATGGTSQVVQQASVGAAFT